jgi:hypothetical protein
MTLFLCYILIGAAGVYYSRIFQENRRIQSKAPHQEQAAFKKIIWVFAAAMLASWMGYGLAAIALSTFNPYIRNAIQKEGRVGILAPGLEAQRQSALYPTDYHLFLFYPPESPGILGLGRYGFAFLCGIVAWEIASRRNIPRRIREVPTPYYRGRKLLGMAEASAKAASFYLYMP